MANSELDKVPRSPYTGIPGWETEAEEDALTALAGEVPGDGVIVELGSEYGRSAGAFLRGSRRSVTLVSVDLFPANHHIVGDLMAEYQKNVAPVGNGRKIGTMQGDSAEAAEHWPGYLIDLLFIDAAHEYDAVQRDILAWVGRVRVGGIVAFHDCATGPDSHYLHHEVNRAIDNWLAGADGSFVERPQVDSLRTFDRVKE